MSFAIIAVGLTVGVFYGAFGAGGSAFATPALALIGVPGVIAIASPLPATLPAAVVGAWSYIKSGHLHRPTLVRALVGGLPATVVGALLARRVDAHLLLVLSGAVLGVMGLAMLRPSGRSERPYVDRPTLVVAIAAAVGFLTGLLANSGGFLLVPLFVIVVGLGMRRAAGTSLVVAAALSLPTVLTHWALGDIDWRVAALFGIGLIPGAALGGRVAQRMRSAQSQRVFGVVLVAASVAFTATRIA